MASLDRREKRLHFSRYGVAEDMSEGKDHMYTQPFGKYHKDAGRGGGGNTKETSPYADKVKFINTGEANILTGCKFTRSSILTGYFSSRQYL